MVSYDELFALRVTLQDDYTDEADIIRQLKSYLLQFMSLEEIDQYLHEFYNSFGINIPIEDLRNVKLDRRFISRIQRNNTSSLRNILNNQNDVSQNDVPQNTNQNNQLIDDQLDQILEDVLNDSENMYDDDDENQFESENEENNINFDEINNDNFEQIFTSINNSLLQNDQSNTNVIHNNNEIINEIQNQLNNINTMFNDSINNNLFQPNLNLGQGINVPNVLPQENFNWGYLQSSNQDNSEENSEENSEDDFLNTNNNINIYRNHLQRFYNQHNSTENDQQSVHQNLGPITISQPTEMNVSTIDSSQYQQTVHQILGPITISQPPELGVSTNEPEQIHVNGRRRRRNNNEPLTNNIRRRNTISQNQIFSQLFNASSIPPQINNIFSNFIQTDPIHMEDVRVTLGEDDLNSIKTMKFSEITDTKIDEKKCSICMTNFDDDEIISIIKCNHIFHEECIKEWLKEYSYKCPVCRTETGTARYDL